MFSLDDRRMTFTDITKLLRARRKLANERITAIAQSQYAATFDKHFSYRKSGNRLVMTAPHVIARKYLALGNSLPQEIQEMYGDSDGDD